jgi:hypothetical protein
MTIGVIGPLKRVNACVNMDVNRNKPALKPKVATNVKLPATTAPRKTLKKQRIATALNAMATQPPEYFMNHMPL